MEENKISKKRIAALICAGIMILGANLLFFLLLWLVNRYDKVQFDQILYQLKSSSTGTHRDLATGAVFRIGFFGFGLTGIEIFLYMLLSGNLKKMFKRSASYIRYTATRVCSFFKRAVLPITGAFLFLSVTFFILRLDVVAYVSTTATKSDFIEDHYVDPATAKITFPEEKRNLIYIFLESMENTFADTSAGGKITSNFIPELTEIRNENISFSNTEGLGGAYAFTGTTWTAAAMFAQTAGTIIKVPIFGEDYGDEDYMPGITTLGDVLKSAGYRQTLFFGSDARFACRDNYFTEHGEYEIIDTVALKNAGRLPKDYSVWWGYEDAKLFEFAKEELTRVSQLDGPFNFTMLTADTHFPDGYECELCGDDYEEQYSNVLACSSRQIAAFIDWIKEQPFYENTTIILSGDHLTMDPEFLAGINEDYVRTSYNCIINSPTVPAKTTNREFGTYDMFPTTLAAIGATIEGDRLGLGTNLFSDRQTLTEEYGFEFLDEELQKKSIYYTEKFYENK